jgi:hypothetical protein
VAGVSTLSALASGQQPDGYPAVGAPAIVTLISAGAAPKSALRYAPPAGSKEHMDMTMTMSMSMDMGGTSVPAMTIPSVTFGADCVVTAVSPSGDLTCTVAFTGLTVEAGANPSVAALMQGMNDDLKSIKGSATISNRGVILTTNIDVSRIVNSPLGQTMGSMTEVMNSVSQPLPEEEVGIGARWEVRNTLHTNGITMFQKAEYELVASDGKTLTLKTKVEQTALPQAMSNPAMPAEADVQLEKYTGTGSGTTRVNLNRLIPTSDGTIENTMVMRVNMAGDSRQMAVTASAKVTIAPGK